MSLTQNSEGKFEYALTGGKTNSKSVHGASNRQKKMLRFFNVAFSGNISVGAAGWEIATIMSSEECREKWHRYLYLTSDFDSDSELLKPFEVSALNTVQIPADWSSSDAFRRFRDELVDDLLHDSSPFDLPQPRVIIPNRTFMFTGKFKLGTRKACQDAVVSREGFAPDQKSVSHLIDYLVIGVEGSKAWRRGTYGNKIEDAIIARRDYGSPAIISEEHWVASFSAPEVA